MTLGGQTFATKKVTVQVKPSFAVDRYFIGSGALKKAPKINGFWEISGTFELEFADLTAYAAFNNLTFAQVVVTMQAPNPIEAGFYPSLTFTMPSVRLDGDTPNVGGPDILGQSVNFMAEFDGTNPALSVRYRTADVAA